MSQDLAFYQDCLGLPEVDRFAGQVGYAGVMPDLPGTAAHLEFTATDHVLPRPRTSRTCSCRTW